MKDKKKLTYLIVLICITLTVILANMVMPNSKVTENLEKVQTELVKEIIVSEETKSEVADTKNAVANGGKVETTQIAKATIKEEQEVTDEGAEDNLEQDALVEQENISYDGDNAGKGLSLLGKWQGLTYYSQADSRWASKLYTSTNNKTQTMKSSACGPTSAAMVVSSAKGAILPTTMASLSVDNGYRTANSGTAWAFYPFVADYFDFKEYYKTDNFTTAMTRLGTDKNKDGVSDYFIICSCGSGLFTSGGHYIVLAGLKGDTIQVFDPYLYNGKFNTASRKVANVKIDGTSAYVSKANFLKYSNFKSFWIYSNDKGNAQKKEEPKKTQSSNSQVKKTTDTKTKTTKSTKSKVKNTVGKKKKLKVKCYLYKNKNLKGKAYTYLKNTTVKVLKNINSKVDCVQVVQTKRKAYIKINNYK